MLVQQRQGDRRQVIVLDPYLQLAFAQSCPEPLARLGLGDDLAGLYSYAIIATVIAVVVLSLLGKAAARLGGEATFEREAEG